jgi:hypothetical protein
MSKAKSIETLANNAADAMELAEDRAIARDQDWSAEATDYTFDDNSVLRVSGSSYHAVEGNA